jgi:hypothetical protein
MRRFAILNAGGRFSDLARDDDVISYNEFPKFDRAPRVGSGNAVENWEAVADGLLERLSALTEEHILIWHEDGRVVEKILETWSGRFPEKVVATIVFKGIAFAGDRGAAQRIEKRWKLHVVSYAIHEKLDAECSGNVDPVVWARFERFAEAMRTSSAGPPPFHLLEPPAWPQDLVAAYIACIAMPRLPKDIAGAVLGIVNWEEAQREYKDLSGGHLDLPSQDPGNWLAPAVDGLGKSIRKVFGNGPSGKKDGMRE